MALLFDPAARPQDATTHLKKWNVGSMMCTCILSHSLYVGGSFRLVHVQCTALR